MYHFSGGGEFPNNTKTIYIEIFKNKTSYSGLDMILTNDIIYEIIRNGNIQIKDMDQADTILSGTITSLTINSLSQTKVGNTIDQRLTIKVDIKLKGSNGNIIRYINDISSDGDYKADLSDKESTDTNKNSAIIELSKKISEKIYNRLTMDF